MQRPWRAGSLGCLVVCSLAFLPGRLLAVAPEIKDDGKFFSAEAVKKADKQIRDIASKYGKDLLIETFAAIPGDQAERVKAMSAQERAKFFRNWATDRAEARVVHGVYILICKEPPRFEIIVTEDTRSAINAQAAAELRKVLLKSFREKHFDEGLQEAVDYVRNKLAEAITR